MQVYRKILVSIDCSPVDEAVIAHVSALARQNDAVVVLLHVVHSHTLDQDRALKCKAESCLYRHRDALREQGVETEVIIRTGEPEPEILAEIEDKDYDLMAMATHGHGFLGGLLFGSVSRILKHKINIPLLLIKAERK